MRKQISERMCWHLGALCQYLILQSSSFKNKNPFKGSNETEVLVDSKQVPQTSPALL